METDNLNIPDRVYVYCCNTGLRLYEMDDSTVAYILECDPTGKLLAMVAGQQKHPALCVFRNDWGRLADCCPHVFLCYLLHKFTVIPNVQRETYAYVQAMGQVSDSIVAMYENDIINDDTILKLVEHLTLVPIISSPTCARPVPSIIARYRPVQHEYFIVLDDIEKLCDDVIAQTRVLTSTQVSRALSSFWEDNHSYVPTLQALYGVKETREETVRRVVKARTKLFLSEKTIAGVEFLTSAPAKPVPPSEEAKALTALTSKPTPQSRAEQINAWGALLAQAMKKNNS